MMMTNRRGLCLMIMLSLFTTALFPQSTAVEKEFIKQLLKEEAGEDKSAIFDFKDTSYSVQLGEELDQYNVYFSMLVHEDLNGDGLDDYVVQRSSQGMLGGNVNTNSQIIYYIMKDDLNPAQEYQILTYAPFSYNILDDLDYTDKTLKAIATQNFRTYMSDDLQSTPLSFVYRYNNLYEESYLEKCEMGKMKNKSIFKTDIGKVVRNLDIDMHNYCEISSEQYTKRDTAVHALLTGCDNLRLEFTVKIKMEPDRVPKINLYKKTVDNTLTFLASNTRYKTVLNKLNSHFQSSDVYYMKNEPQNGKFDKTWNYSVSKFEYDQKTKIYSFGITLESIVNPNQDENWDITIRRK